MRVQVGGHGVNWQDAQSTTESPLIPVNIGNGSKD